MAPRCVFLLLPLAVGGSATDAYSWVASDFGDCARYTGCPLAFKSRTVDCKRAFDGSPGSADQCKGTPPPSLKSCDCGFVVCADAALPPSTPTCAALEALAAVGGDEWELDYEEVGCYAKAAGDDDGVVAPGADPRDLQCMTWSGTAPCRSGLPFYRVRSNAMSPELCFNFCVSKGMDVFGLAETSECRCGGSKINKNAFGDFSEPRASSLVFAPSKLTQHPGCDLKVYRYKGHFEEGGIPFMFLNVMSPDEDYLASILKGSPVSEEDSGAPSEASFIEQEELEEDGEAEEADEEEEVEEESSQDPPAGQGWNRNCWPSNCGPGRGPWQTRTPNAPGNQADVWEEYVLVNYAFWANLDSTRKNAFRQAVQAWKDNTCINLIEISQNITPYVEVGVYDTGSCYLSGMGWPGPNGKSRINLGWCRTMNHVGSMIHEIGHALGMNHEQKRADAQQQYYGKGPHLQMYWQNVPSRWVPQYTPAYSSYIGSKDDGAGDPQIGYEAYDFESIMHYGGGNRFDTIPSEKEQLVGNRRHLTAGDIEQALDQYQCKRVTGIKTTTTTTTTTVDPSWNVCSFEHSFCHWTQSQQDTFDWSIGSGSTPSSGTGPTGAHDGVRYAYIETSSPRQNGDRAILETIVQTTPSSKLSFWYSMVGSTIGTLEVLVDGSSVWRHDGPKGGTHGSWSQAELNLAGGTVRIQFVGTRGSSYTGDIALDQVMIISPPEQLLLDNAKRDMDAQLANFTTACNAAWSRIDNKLAQVETFADQILLVLRD